MRMLEMRADLKVLICSGSPFFIEKLPVALRRQVVFLQKPFVPKMLAEAVERAKRVTGREAAGGNGRILLFW